MADRVEFHVENIAGFKRAMQLAPKTIKASIAREFKREGAKFQTAYRKGFLFGSPGINLPARLETITKRGKRVLKKRTNKDAKAVQSANVQVKAVAGKNGIVLVAYLSKFLGFHAAKLASGFHTLFRIHAQKIKPRVEKEVARITKAAINKGLRDRGNIR